MQKVSSISKNIEQFETSYIASESKIAESILKNYFVISTMLSRYLLCDPAIPLLGGCAMEMQTYIYQDTHKNAIAALFIITKNWKPFIHPSKAE